MTNLMKKSLLALMLLAVVFTLGACSVEQTQEAEMPDVDVDVDAGALPKFDVDWADVDVGTRTKMVTVPKVVVVMEEVEVEVPYVDVNMPNRESEEQTIVVEAEIAAEMSKVEIEEVYATGERLIVVSRLTPTGEMLDDQRVRISDRIVIRAPELDVRHYVVGAKPDGNWNSQYRFVANRAELDERIGNARKIYN